MSKSPTVRSEELRKICRDFNVKELYLFGSAATGNLSSDSDLDFLVNFDRKDYKGAFDQFMDFKLQLEELYNRPIDLYHIKKFRNSIFQKELDQTKKLVYGA